MQVDSSSAPVEPAPSPFAAQLYVQVPVVKNGTETGSTTTAVATLWLRRVGGGQAGPYALPHQAEDAIRGFLWLVSCAETCLHYQQPTVQLWIYGSMHGTPTIRHYPTLCRLAGPQ